VITATVQEMSSCQCRCQQQQQRQIHKTLYTPSYTSVDCSCSMRQTSRMPLRYAPVTVCGCILLVAWQTNHHRHRDSLNKHRRHLKYAHIRQIAINATLLLSKQDDNYICCYKFPFWLSDNINKTKTNILQPLHMSSCVRQHSQLRTGGFYWSQILLPACHCWWEVVHSYYRKFTRALLSSVTYTISFSTPFQIM